MEAFNNADLHDTIYIQNLLVVNSGEPWVSSQLKISLSQQGVVNVTGMWCTVSHLWQQQKILQAVDTVTEWALANRGTLFYDVYNGNLFNSDRTFCLPDILKAENDKIKIKL